ncbi:MAG: LysR family transcriptional regulator [Acidimicrobiia bacterium]|nr:LysR family transcriptional regulator [Acidimicrobiia bacterium]
MDVRQLAALVAIADHGTFSAAARALYTVQSNVSSHLARLERELGTTLVDRGHGGLTEDGVRVVERARRILRELDNIAAEASAVDGEVTGDVRIGILGTTARWLLPRLLSTLDVAHPHLHTIVSEGSTSVLLPGVLSGRFNAAVIHLPVDDPELVIEPLFAEELVLVAHHDHPLGRRGEVAVVELAQHRLLLPPAGTALRRVLDRAAGALGVTLRAQAQIDGVRLLATLALDGHGAAIVPATAVPGESNRRERTAQVPGLPPRVVALAYQRRPAPGAPTRALFEVLRETVAALAEDQPGVRLGSAAFPLSRAV